jgi:thiamine-phosphate pyrophosphorylase
MTPPLARLRFDPSLYYVLDPLLLGGRELEDTLRAALAGGVTLVQLRDKQATSAGFLTQARRIQAVLRGSGVPLIINDRVDVAAELRAEGVHVGQSDMSVAEVRQRLGAEAIVGLSISDSSDLASVDPAQVDYVGLGPIFSTRTKSDAAPVVGLRGLRDMRPRLSIPLVGIGGIDASNAADVIAAGADGVAVVSFICAAADPRLAARRLQHAVAEGRGRGQALS